MQSTIEAREKLWHSVEGLTYEQLNAKVVEGKWTIMQVLEHLYLMERAITQGMKLALAEEGEHPTSLKPFHLTLDRSRRIEAPVHLVPSAKPETLEDIHAKLDRSRQALLETVEEVNYEVLTHKSYPHPVFGQMDVKQWLTFVGVHEQRHMAQIEELKHIAHLS